MIYIMYFMYDSKFRTLQMASCLNSLMYNKLHTECTCKKNCNLT